MQTRFPQHDSRLAETIASFCREGHDPPPKGLRDSFPSSPIWKAVAATGTSLWLDTGDVEAAGKLWTREFQALTTNNTLLNKEVQKGIYDDLIPRAAALVKNAGADLEPAAVVKEVAFVLNAVHGLSLVRSFDADVSVELHTDVANDAEASYHYARRFQAICPDRFIVKIPLTPAGILVARRLSDEGVRLNFTLGFSARQNALIALLARPTWVNVFMGRINAFVKDNGLGDGENAGEKATLASQRELRRLDRERGIRVRQIGASMRNGGQVRDLMGLDVFTIPTSAASDFLAGDPDPDSFGDRTQDDPKVEFAEGADPTGLDAFWSVDDGFRSMLSAAAEAFSEKWSASDLLSFLRDHGCGDLFPSFDPPQIERLTRETKIPRHASWKDMVAAGTCSWDGALTAAALCSFAQDQKALDYRIRGLL
ncbi:MAG: hypothetical protein Fur0037_01140 [Planctomycetota bacterium]